MNDGQWRCDWVNRKCEIAETLPSRVSDAGYGDSILILCAALNAMAAEIWPGQPIDHVRFVEMLIRFSDVRPCVANISVPLLVQCLRAKRRFNQSTAVRRKFLTVDFSRILSSDEVDKAEDEIALACPSMKKIWLREFSYSSLLYQEVRSAYSHEYQPGLLADSWPMTRNPRAGVSYVNRATDQGPNRFIHFHVNWIAQVARSISETLRGVSVPIPNPQVWWAQAPQGKVRLLKR